MAGEGQSHPDELKELERELRALVPRGPRVEMARMMYLAGQASMSPVPPTAPGVAPKAFGWMWPLSTGAMKLVALWLGALLLVSHAPDVLVNTPRSNTQHPHPLHPVLPPNNPAPALAENGAPAVVPGTTTVDARYLRDRQTAIRDGVEALPPSGTVGSSEVPGTYGSLTRKLMNEQRAATHRATMWSELFNQ